MPSNRLIGWYEIRINFNLAQFKTRVTNVKFKIKTIFTDLFWELEFLKLKYSGVLIIQGFALNNHIF